MSRTAASEICARVAGLRTSGRVHDALAVLNSVLDDLGDDPAVLRESLRLALLIGDPELARDLYDRLRGRGDPAVLRGLQSALARLQLELPGRDVEAPPGDPGTPDAGWLEELVRGGEDQTAPVTVEEIHASSPGGGITYEIRAACPWCKAPQQLRARMSLMLDREWLCPACFGRLQLRYEGVRDYLRRRHPLLVSDGAYNWIAPFLELLRDLGAPGRDDDETPGLCRQLNQQYVFFLSQLLTDRLFGGARVNAILVAGLFPDRHRTFFETLCREFPVLAFEDCGFPRGQRFPYTRAEEFVGDGTELSSRELAWQVGGLRRHAERRLSAWLQQDCTLREHEFDQLYELASMALRATERMRRLAAATPLGMVVTSADYDGNRRPWVLAARESGIPTLCIEHGSLAPIPWPGVLKPENRRSLSYASEHVNLDNAIEVEAAERAHQTVCPDLQRPEFLALGTPHDVTPETDLDPAGAREALGLAPDRFTIAVLGSWSEARAPADLFKGQIEAAEAYRELFRAFAGWSRRDSAQLLVKLHPSHRDPELRDETVRCLRRLAIEAGCPPPPVLVDRLPETLMAADLLVGFGFTSVFWEAFLLGRPAVVFPVPHYRNRLVRPDALEQGGVLLESGVLRPAFGAEELFTHAEEWSDPDARERHAATVAELKRRYGIVPRTAQQKSDRICAWIRDRLDPPEAEVPRGPEGA